MRLFVAADLDEEASRALEERARKLVRRAEAAGWRASWVKPDVIHLTLKFLGEVPEAKTAPIQEALAAALAPAHSFPLLIDGLGTFPPHGRPKVLFLALRDGGREATELASRVEGALGPLGFPAEGRPFHPHLTLGRVKKAPKDGLALLGKEPVSLAGRVTGVTLFRSFLDPGGARHVPVRRIVFPLPG